MSDTRRPALPVEEPGTLSLNVPSDPVHQEHEAQGTAAPYGHRWCPYCGADLSGVPVREESPEEAMFALAGRRLKVALAVVFVVLWLGVSLFDWVNDPGTPLVPGWFSALGVIVFGFLLGIEPVRWLRRRS